jgi:heavy metal sensor kinase
MWYAALLAGALLLFATATYAGLARYLKTSLEDSITKEARAIAGVLLVNVQQSGEEYVVNEINEHYAPEINGQLIRVTRPNGTLLFVSGPAKDGSFDPKDVPRDPVPKQEFSHEVSLAGGPELLVHELPYAPPEGGTFLIEVGSPNQQIEKVLYGLSLTFAFGLPVIVAFAIGSGYVLMRRALRPVDQITSSAERITSRSLGERLPVVQSGDEIERLCQALNRMIARLDESFQQINRFSADASHELRTPLTIIQGELEGILERADLSAQVRETIASTLEEVQRLTKIVEHLLMIARLEAGEARMERIRFDLGELACATADQMRLLADEKHIVLECRDGGAAVWIEGDRDRLKQVIVNLLDNAIKYTPEAGRIELRVARTGDRAILKVADSGPGVAKEDLPHIFERFYRADKARSRQGGGTGLGLSIARSICVANGGTMRVTSNGDGSTFAVELPVSHPSAQ